MPIYEYHCSSCERDFELLVLGKEEVCCPVCNSREVTRLMSTFSHKSDKGFSSSQGSGCGTCSATSCATCGSS